MRNDPGTPKRDGISVFKKSLNFFNFVFYHFRKSCWRKKFFSDDTVCITRISDLVLGGCIGRGIKMYEWFVTSVMSVGSSVKKYQLKTGAILENVAKLQAES